MKAQNFSGRKRAYTIPDQEHAMAAPSQLSSVIYGLLSESRSARGLELSSIFPGPDVQPRNREDASTTRIRTRSITRRLLKGTSELDEHRPVSRFSFLTTSRPPATREPGAPWLPPARDSAAPESTARWPSDG